MKELSTEFFPFPVDGKWDIPVMEKQDLDVEEIMGFNYVLSKPEHEKVVHFFLDDHEFLRVWNSPDRYTKILSDFAGCFSPDFSLWSNLSLAVQVYNTYRNRYIGRLWQSSGLKVIPSIGWSDERSYEFCFSGVTKGSRVVISTRGVAKTVEAIKLFKQGYDDMIHRIEPEVIYIFGARKRIEEHMEFSEAVSWLPSDDLHF